MTDLGPRNSEDEGVECKGCGRIHYFRGFRANVSWKYKGTELISIFCPAKDRMYDYDVNEDKIIYTSEKITFERLELKILELEERIQSLEVKTAELPESDGIKQLKDEIMREHAQASGTDASKRKVPNG